MPFLTTLISFNYHLLWKEWVKFFYNHSKDQTFLPHYSLIFLFACQVQLSQRPSSGTSLCTISFQLQARTATFVIQACFPKEPWTSMSPEVLKSGKCSKTKAQFSEGRELDFALCILELVFLFIWSAAPRLPLQPSWHHNFTLVKQFVSKLWVWFFTFHRGVKLNKISTATKHHDWTSIHCHNFRSMIPAE